MKSINSYPVSTTKALRHVGLMLLLMSGHGSVLADRLLLISTTLDTQITLADSFVFTPLSPVKISQTQATITTPIRATYASNTYTIGLAPQNNDNVIVNNSFQDSRKIHNKPLKMITDRKQRNYLALGSRVSTPFINGVYAYLSYHPVETNNPHDTSRLLSLGGRLEF